MAHEASEDVKLNMAYIHTLCSQLSQQQAKEDAEQLMDKGCLQLSQFADATEADVSAMQLSVDVRPALVQRSTQQQPAQPSALLHSAHRLTH